MPDIVVLSENILDIALWFKNQKWPSFGQGQAINWYICRTEYEQVPDFGVYYMIFRYARSSGVVEIIIRDGNLS